MINYDERGIINPDRMTQEERLSYLNEKNLSFCENSEFKISSLTYGYEMNGQYYFKFPSEILFKFKEFKIVVKWKVDGIDPESGTNIVTRNLQYGNDKLGSRVLYDDKIIDLKHSFFTFSFKFPNHEKFNDFLVCYAYLSRLLYLAKKENDELPKTQVTVTNNIQQKPTSLNSNLENETLNLQKEKNLRISNFKDTFLKNYRCDDCGSVNSWTSMVFEVDDDEYFHFSASCRKCDTFMIENGYIKDYKFPVTSAQPNINYTKAPWDTQYLNHRCPYCGAMKVRYAKWDDKAYSTAFWGLFSPKLHCNYKCDSCKKMWE